MLQTGFFVVQADRTKPNRTATSLVLLLLNFDVMLLNISLTEKRCILWREPIFNFNNIFEISFTIFYPENDDQSFFS